MYVFLPLSLFSIRQYNLNMRPPKLTIHSYKKPLKRDFYNKSKKKKKQEMKVIVSF